MPEPTHVSIPVETVNKILTNLGEQPLKNVLDLFAELKGAAEKSLAEQRAAGQ